MPQRFAEMPRSLKERARWVRLGEAAVPAMIVRPQAEAPCPVVIWMHGRTVNKETDPGRYLRWLRAGIGACALDLPGHGERYDAIDQAPARTLDVVIRMMGEIDGVTDALRETGAFDMERVAIGGMSAGGMAALARLCGPHPFRCACVEATSGSWQHQRHRVMFRDRTTEEVERFNPITHLDRWREIPLQAISTRADEWVAFEGQATFLEALRERYVDPGLVELIEYERTGAPYEHAGFGRMAADAKNRQRDFFVRWLSA